MVDLRAEQSTVVLRIWGRTGCLLGCSLDSDRKSQLATLLSRPLDIDPHIWISRLICRLSKKHFIGLEGTLLQVDIPRIAQGARRKRQGWLGLWFRSGLALSKWFLCPSPASHKGHENSGKNYHQHANNNPRKFPDSALCLNCSFFFRHTSRFPRSRRGVWRDDLCILPTSPGTKRTMFNRT